MASLTLVYQVLARDVFYHEINLINTLIEKSYEKISISIRPHHRASHECLHSTGTDS